MGNSFSPFGADTQRYWDARYDLFSRFDEIQIDKTGLFSVKPEKVALEIASRLAGENVLDGFTGVGGSAIAFARADSRRRVITVDTDCSQLEMAKHNAHVYGVENQIQFLNADICTVLRNPSVTYDRIYLDPPWGGPGYSAANTFNLSMFEPNGSLLLKLCLDKRCSFALTVPKNFDFTDLSGFPAPYAVEKNELRGRLLFYTVYFEAQN